MALLGTRSNATLVVIFIVLIIFAMLRCPEAKKNKNKKGNKKGEQGDNQTEKTPKKDKSKGNAKGNSKANSDDKGLQQLIQSVGNVDETMISLSTKMEVSDDKVENLTLKVNRLGDKVDGIDEKIDDLGGNLEDLRNLSGKIDARIGTFERKLGHLAVKMELFDGKIEGFDGNKTADVNGKLGHLAMKLKSVDEKIDKLATVVEGFANMFASAALTPAVKCPSGWESVPSDSNPPTMCYHVKECGGPECNRTKAAESCESLGASLMNMQTRNISLVMRKLTSPGRVKRPGHFWVGGSYNETTEEWVWMDGTLVKDGFTSWKEGDPQIRENPENCMTLHKGEWFDQLCSEVLDGYACEMVPDDV